MDHSISITTYYRLSSQSTLMASLSVTIYLIQLISLQKISIELTAGPFLPPRSHRHRMWSAAGAPCEGAGEGHTYVIIERSLRKKQNGKKDSFEIKEEMDIVDKYWANMVTKDIPKHHRFFVNFHRKQLTDAKRFLENSLREGKMKVIKSLKLTRGASIRTQKLACDVLWCFGKEWIKRWLTAK